MRKVTVSLALFLLFLGWTSLPGLSQETNKDAGKDVTVTVTVERRGPSAPAVLHPDDIFVYQNNQQRPVDRWVPATGNDRGLDLAILIDDSLDHAIGSHYGEIKDFIRSLPTGSKVAVAYGMHGDVRMAQDFTTDHERAAAAIRITLGQLNQTSSIYMALTALLKRFPNDGNRHAVLLLTDGIDLYWGVTDALPANNRDLHQAVAEAQRQGVNVYAIYAETAGEVRRSAFLVNVGQSCLALVALETGGKNYSEGLQTPINFQDIFRRLKERLGNQYLLTFCAEQGKKDAFDRLHLTTEQPSVELVAPSHVYVPGIGSGTL
jgi:hypothetical protein